MRRRPAECFDRRPCRAHNEKTSLTLGRRQIILAGALCCEMREPCGRAQRVFILFVARRSLDQSHKRSIQKQLLFCRAPKLQSEWEGRCRAELRLDFLVLLYWNQKFSSRTSFVFIIGNGCFFVSLNRVCCVLLPRATEIIICLETNHSSAPKYPPPPLPRSSSLSLFTHNNMTGFSMDGWMDGRMNLFLIALEPTMFFMCTSDRRFYYVTWILYTDLWFPNWNSSSARNLWAGAFI